jgi:hypothetical protein
LFPVFLIMIAVGCARLSHDWDGTWRLVPSKSQIPGSNFQITLSEGEYVLDYGGRVAHPRYNQTPWVPHPSLFSGEGWVAMNLDDRNVVKSFRHGETHPLPAMRLFSLVSPSVVIAGRRC